MLIPVDPPFPARSVNATFIPIIFPVKILVKTVPGTDPVRPSPTGRLIASLRWRVAVTASLTKFPDLGLGS
jgi:hypothetical protein